MSEASADIYIVDDDLAVREALDSLLRAAGYRTRLFASAGELLVALDARLPDCLVLDVQLPDRNGLDLQAELVKRAAVVPIVFVTGHGDIPMSVRAMKAGAVEFLPKPFTEQELLDGVAQAVAQGRARRDPTDADPLRGAHASLSPREREVLAMVVRGMLNKQIAAELGTVEPTVKRQRAAMMRKMGATSLAELVRMAIRLGLPTGTTRS